MTEVVPYSKEVTFALIVFQTRPLIILQTSFAILVLQLPADRSNVIMIKQSCSLDSWNVAKDTLNTNRCPSITSDTKISATVPDNTLTNDCANLELDAVAMRIVERVPVYRELDNDQDLPTWKRYLYRVFPQPIRNALKPPTKREEWKNFIFIHLPIVHWILNYTPNLLIGDFISGLTIGVTHIPQGK